MLPTKAKGMWTKQLSSNQSNRISLVAIFCFSCVEFQNAQSASNVNSALEWVHRQAVKHRAAKTKIPKPSQPFRPRVYTIPWVTLFSNMSRDSCSARGSS